MNTLWTCLTRLNHFPFLVLKSERHTKATGSKNEGQSAIAVGFSYPRRKKIIYLVYIYPIGF
ncbi:hypothetical protein Hanom_Chr16g01517261 [Helianthus anomalus]